MKWLVNALMEKDRRTWSAEACSSGSYGQGGLLRDEWGTKEKVIDLLFLSKGMADSTKYLSFWVSI